MVESNTNLEISIEDICGGASVAGAPVSIGLGQGQSLISSPVRKKKANEAYLNNGNFDEDQELMLQIVREEGNEVDEFVTPNNSPEQIYELANSKALGMPEEKLKILADPSISFMAIQAVNKAYKKGIDLTVYLPWADPNVLNQGFLGALHGLDINKFMKPGLDARQMEQMRKELEAGGDPGVLSGDYNKMRAQRFPGHNISNTEEKIPKGQGISTRNGARNRYYKNRNRNN